MDGLQTISGENEPRKNLSGGCWFPRVRTPLEIKKVGQVGSVLARDASIG